MQQGTGFFLARLPAHERVEELEDAPQYPYLAAATSWVETLAMPHSDIQKKFRTSELVMMGWRSREQAIAFHKRAHKPAPLQPMNQFGVPKLETVKPTSEGMPESVLAEVKDEWGNVIGYEPDMRKMTAAQMVQHLTQCGYKVPYVPLPKKKAN